jgi:site-specific recombinase XerD
VRDAVQPLARDRNLLLAQQLLRHESVATTQGYLHPSRDDLAQALTRLQVVNPDSQS